MTITEIILVSLIVVLAIIHIVIYIRYRTLLDYVSVLCETIEQLISGDADIQIMDKEDFEKMMEDHRDDKE